MLSKLLKLDKSLLSKLRQYSSRPDIERKLPPQLQFNVSGPKRLSRSQTWAEWIVTTPGRQAVCAATVTATLTVTTGLWMAETIFPSVTQTFYSEQIPDIAKVPLRDQLVSGEEASIFQPPAELVKLSAKLWQRAGLTAEEHENIEVFTSNLLDPVIIGTTHCREGASVGFPRHMMWTKEDDIDLTHVRIKPYWNLFFPGFSIPEDADPEDLQELKESLILSPAAREFIVSKQMNVANGYLSWMQVFMPGAFMMLHYVNGVTVNQKLDLISKPRYQRLGFQLLWLYVVIVTFILASNMLKQFTERVHLENVVSSSDDARAALEYYTQSIKRNKILRKILGPDSHYYFLEDGDISPNVHEFKETSSSDSRGQC